MKIVNKTNDNIVVQFLDIDLFVALPANKEVVIESEKIICKNVVLRKEKSRYSLLGTLMALIVSIPLTIVYYFEFTKIDEEILLPTKYCFGSKEPNVFEIFESNEKLKNYTGYADKEKVESELFFTEEDLKKEIASYKYSNMIMLFFPFAFLGILVGCFLLNGKIDVAITFILVLVIMMLPLILKHRSNKRIIETIRRSNARKTEDGSMC